MSGQCTIRELYAYPVKSCRGVSVDSIELSPTGVAGDRQLMVLKNGKFTNQARIPALAKVAPERIDTQCITFAADDTDSLKHTVSNDGAESTIQFYGNPVAVIDQGDALADWVSRVTGSNVRIAALKETFTRSVPLKEFSIVDGIDQSRFVDVAPILLTNQTSLDDLNARLEASVPMNRFRPNIVVEGLDAFAEDNLDTLEAGDLQLMRATHCERCQVTCTDQQTGERHAEPFATLKTYRHRDNGYAGGVMFGAYMGVSGSRVLRVGDTLHVR